MEKTFTLEPTGQQSRRCGGCTACCEIVSVKELGLKSFHGGCPHLATVLHARGPGCSIYAGRPASCRGWSCAWLVGPPEEWRDDLRPDRCGFVVDTITDLIRVNGVEREAAQIWVAKGSEDAWRHDPANAVILAAVDTGLYVLWRMWPGRLAITFGKDPVTGQIGHSAPTEFTGDDVLGDEVERQRRILEMDMQAKPVRRAGR